MHSLLLLYPFLTSINMYILQGSVCECVCVRSLARQLPRHGVHNAFVRVREASVAMLQHVLFPNYALHKAATITTTRRRRTHCDYMLHKNAFSRSSCHRANCSLCQSLPLSQANIMSMCLWSHWSQTHTHITNHMPLSCVL